MCVQNFRSVAQKLWPLRSGHIYILYIHTDRRVKQEKPEANQNMSSGSVLVSVNYRFVETIETQQSRHMGLEVGLCPLFLLNSLYRRASLYVVGDHCAVG